MFPPSGEGRETPAMLGRLERSNLSHLTRKTHTLWGPLERVNLNYFASD